MEPREARSGARLYLAVEGAYDQARHGAIDIVPVACLSSCKRSCNVAVSQAGKWTYVYGDLSPEHAEALLAAVRQYGEAPDGLVPWRERPDFIKKGALARIPPLGARP
jgi:predicted metal-binding protein